MKRKFFIYCILAVFTVFVTACGSTGALESENPQRESLRDIHSEPEQQENAPAEAESAGSDTEDVQAAPKITGNVIQTAGSRIPFTELSHIAELPDAPVVYFTSDISAEGLLAIYQALGWKPEGSVAVKISTGESDRSNYLRPELIGGLVQEMDGTIVECMTAYGGSRATAAMHNQVAVDRGYTQIADFDLMDEDGEMELPLTGGDRIDKAIVGSHVADYDNFLILSHFKGHGMAGFGGAIKNVAIGMSSRHGKVYVHTAGERTEGSIYYNDQDAWLEALPEAVLAVSDYMNDGENIIYINVMNRLSVDCDCDGNPAEPDMHDVGILASTDPVALDQACVDFVYAVPDGGSLIARMESKNGIHALEHAEEIGLGVRNYRLVNIDE